MALRIKGLASEWELPFIHAAGALLAHRVWLSKRPMLPLLFWLPRAYAAAAAPIAALFAIMTKK